jgi:CheY-like chemotaxis protein
MNLMARQSLESKVVHNDDGKPRRVLYAGDNSITSNMNVAVLRVMGFDIDVAGDGENALTVATENAYDIIVLDLDVHLLDGFEVAHRIRSGWGPSRRAKILACSGNREFAGSHPVRRNAFDGGLRNPTTRHELRGVLQDLMDGELKAGVIEKKSHTLLPKTQVVARIAGVVEHKAEIFERRFQLPTNEDGTVKWHRFARGLPTAFTEIVITLAVVQAHAFTVDIANGFASRNDLAILNARQGLSSIAESFGMEEVKRVLAAYTGASIGGQSKALSAALANWQSCNVKLPVAA